MIGPVAELRGDARAWTLGQPWDFPPPRGAGPEVADLHRTMGEMAGRLNAQYEKEVEFGRLKASLVSLASHEFNNALSVIGSTANLLLQTEPAPPTGRRAEYYTIVNSNLRGLALAVRNLLDLGLLEAGRFAVRPRRAELARVLADAAQALKPLYERKSLHFALEAPGEPAALADPEALLLVATNLIGNAIKYTPDGGAVTAGVVAEPDGRLRVYVSDTGIGISPEDRAGVTTGQRTKEGRKIAHGFGLGLTLVKKILDAHGCALEIEGEPGKGTRFSFVLPVWTGPAEPGLTS
ncbi:MAG: HAMP domain-containing histidine kinase [Elusimicrobia bacterium]|nr:HAMP domain-containing histidine kinase [Elusimicrobiota bacterium]